MSWIFHECERISYYQCEALNHPGLIQAFTTRRAGNMALHTGDAPAEVKKRHHLFLQCLGLDDGNLVAARQVHGVQVALIDRNTPGRGATDLGDLIPDTDALITREPGVVLSIFTADCLPIFIYDPVTPAIGIIHAGWRGSLARIAAITVERMVEHFGTDPGRCLAGIGPAICRECFQVSPELADTFSKEIPEAVICNATGCYVDLPLFNAKVLQSVGIMEASIDYSKLCTVCHPGEFFSYRASQSPGRMMGVIALKESSWGLSG